MQDKNVLTSWVIIVAAGSGVRFGQLKQFLLLEGKQVIEWSLQAVKPLKLGVIVVLPPGVDAPDLDGVDYFVEGGKTRAESVKRGIDLVPADAEIVLIHDAARPMASTELFASVIKAIQNGADAAVPGLAVSDTLKKVQGDKVQTVPREEFILSQTPQSFKAQVIRKAHESIIEATDDAALVEELGMKIHIVKGEPYNIKITYPHDLILMSCIIKSGIL